MEKVEPKLSASMIRWQRAVLLQYLRSFFAERGVLEVETPILGQGAPWDPALESWTAQGSQGEVAYLQTSPEYPMKRLLVEGSGDIYQICKVFRGEEQGPRHNPEFTLLEWYRLGFDHLRLIHEVLDLIRFLVAQQSAWHAPVALPQWVTYADVLQAQCGLDPLSCTPAQCREQAERAGVEVVGELDRDAWLDVLMALVIAPRFPPDRLTVIYDFPETQAILARPNPAHPGYASRFEVYWGALELANGFHELTDVAVYQQRLQRDRMQRERAGQGVPRADEHFAQAMAQGLPDCAGVALGVDRLLMCLLGVATIQEVLNFPWGKH